MTPVLAVAIPLAVALVAVVVLARALAAARAEARQRKELAEARADQIAVVCHELRTPLALISGPLELLLEESPGPLTAQQRDFLGTMRRNTAALNDLAEDLLVQSRIEAGAYPYHETVIDLRRLGQQAVEDIRSLYDNSIAFDCPGRPPYVLGDPRLLLQVIVNLLTNACRHSGSDLITLQIRQQSSQTLISVDDLGIGLTRDHRKALFTRYTTFGTGNIGVGIGMTIARDIVRLHGSELHIRSSRGSGTTFMFGLRNAGSDA